MLSGIPYLTYLTSYLRAARSAAQKAQAISYTSNDHDDDANMKVPKLHTYPIRMRGWRRGLGWDTPSFDHPPAADHHQPQKIGHRPPLPCIHAAPTDICLLLSTYSPYVYPQPTTSAHHYGNAVSQCAVNGNDSPCSKLPWLLTPGLPRHPRQPNS